MAGLLAVACRLLGVGTAQAVTIDFDSEGLTGPQSASQATARTVSVPTSAGIVTFSGGAILTHAAEPPADATSVYATSSSLPGGANPIVITLPGHVLNFSIDLYNGMDKPEYLQAADTFGFLGSSLVPSNALLGKGGVYFIRAGNVVTVSQLGWAVRLRHRRPQLQPAPAKRAGAGAARAVLRRVRRPGAGAPARMADTPVPRAPPRFRMPRAVVSGFIQRSSSLTLPFTVIFSATLGNREAELETLLTGRST